jgi:uncharacterized membrane-anchored protein YitT (DUF2179 family)
MALFLTPCHIVPGGASGAAITLHHFFPLPVGIWILLLNLPLLLLSTRMLGWRKTARTAAGVLSTSTATDLFSFLPPATEDPLLAALVGSFILGAGCGLLLPRGFTTGGSDLAAYLLCSRFPKFRLGSAILGIDASIIVLSAVLLRDTGGLLYSAAAAASFTVALNTVTSSLGKAKLSVIVTAHPGEIGDAIQTKMNRGATVLRGIGWYSGEERAVILCVVKRSELYSLKALVRTADAGAFLIVTDAAEVLGNGFSDLS